MTETEDFVKLNCVLFEKTAYATAHIQSADMRTSCMRVEETQQNTGIFLVYY